MRQVAGFIAAIVMIGMAITAQAAQKSGVFKKSVQHGGIVFDISSRPVQGNAIHIVTITARKGAKTVARYKCDVDYQPHSVWATDLAGDGKTELVIASAKNGKTQYGVLEIFVPEGERMRRIAMPAPEDPTGYRGKDSFELDGRQIIRTFPIYRDGDEAGKPSGGDRTLKYEYKDGRLTMYIQSENQAVATPPEKPAEAPKAEPVAPKAEAPAAQAPPAATEPAPAAAPTPAEPASAVAPTVPETAAAPESRIQPVVPAAVPARKTGPAKVTAVTVTEKGIEIATGSKVEKFKFFHMDKPRRIIIDIPGATSDLASRKLELGKFGMAKARIGQNKGFLRIVLDSDQKTLAKHNVTATDNGLFIDFGVE